MAMYMHVYNACIYNNYWKAYFIGLLSSAQNFLRVYLLLFVFFSKAKGYDSLMQLVINFFYFLLNV